jgi:hypothetical protein
VLTKTSGTDYATTWSGPGPLGVVSYTRKTTADSTITAIWPVITAASWTMVAGRRYRFAVELEIQSTAAGDIYLIGIVKVNTGLYEVRRYWTAPAANAADTFALTWYTNVSFSGAATWRVDVVRVAGSGSATVFGDAVGPNATPASSPLFSSMVIEDVGLL